MFDCNCTSTGFSGSTCDNEIRECDSSPCMNAGSCEDLIGGYVCNCGETNYSGLSCENIVDECLVINCFSGGTCREGICDCFGTGYEGETCQIEILECSSSELILVLQCDMHN